MAEKALTDVSQEAYTSNIGTQINNQGSRMPSIATGRTRLSK